MPSSPRNRTGLPHPVPSRSAPTPNRHAGTAGRAGHAPSAPPSDTNPSNPSAEMISNNDVANNFGFADQQLVSRSAHTGSIDPVLGSDRARRRRPALSHPLRDRRRVIPRLLADLDERHAPASHRQHIHELLLRHHEQRSLQPSRCLVARQAGGTTRHSTGFQEEPHPTPAFADRRTRFSLIAHTHIAIGSVTNRDSRISTALNTSRFVESLLRAENPHPIRPR